MILLIDNYDSFVHNLARYFRRLGQEVCVVRNDVLAPREIHRLEPDAVVLSPGPCTPGEAGISLELVRSLHKEIPLLGVCLGHQAIAEALGARVIRASQPMHGRVSTVFHCNSPMFAEVPPSLDVCRYHSLVVDPESVPRCLNVTATTSDGMVMALEHANLPVVGVQFHPEATLTQFGYQLLKNFLELAGINVTANVAELAASEFQARLLEPPAMNLEPRHPITF